MNTNTTTIATDTSTPTSRHRSRWAAIGAAVAVSLGAGTVGFVGAAGPSASAYVPITSCRAIDTRSAEPIGPRSSPLGSRDVLTVAARAGSGQCSALPADAVAVSLNVTALGATLPTHLTIWPTGVAMPNSSSLNPSPNQPPTPNAVTTPLSAAGSFDVFNFQGSVEVIVDVTGYYTEMPAGGTAPHDHDARYYTKEAIDDWAGELDDQLGLVAYAPLGDTTLSAQSFRADVGSGWQISPYLSHTTISSVECVSAPIEIMSTDGSVLITDVVVTYEAATTVLLNTSITVVDPVTAPSLAATTESWSTGANLAATSGTVKHAVLPIAGSGVISVGSSQNVSLQVCASKPITLATVAYRAGNSNR
ncbi:MAG: hypothetical protein KDB37_19670 [Ilumatobacter sp.]|nr:hypothetical protein [Ilumatobacter sp.]